MLIKVLYREAILLLAIPLLSTETCSQYLILSKKETAHRLEVTRDQENEIVQEISIEECSKWSYADRMLSRLQTVIRKLNKALPAVFALESVDSPLCQLRSASYSESDLRWNVGLRFNAARFYALYNCRKDRWSRVSIVIRVTPNDSRIPSIERFTKEETMDSCGVIASAFIAVDTWKPAITFENSVEKTFEFDNRELAPGTAIRTRNGVSGVASLYTGLPTLLEFGYDQKIETPELPVLTTESAMDSAAWALLSRYDLGSVMVFGAYPEFSIPPKSPKVFPTNSRYQSLAASKTACATYTPFVVPTDAMDDKGNPTMGYQVMIDAQTGAPITMSVMSTGGRPASKKAVFDPAAPVSIPGGDGSFPVVAYPKKPKGANTPVLIRQGQAYFRARFDEKQNLLLIGSDVFVLDPNAIPIVKSQIQQRKDRAKLNPKAKLPPAATPK